MTSPSDYGATPKNAGFIPITPLIAFVIPNVHLLDLQTSLELLIIGKRPFQHEINLKLLKSIRFGHVLHPPTTKISTKVQPLIFVLFGPNRINIFSPSSIFI